MILSFLDCFGEDFSASGAMWRGDPPHGRLQSLPADLRRCLQDGFMQILDLGASIILYNSSDLKISHKYKYNLFVNMDRIDLLGEGKRRNNCVFQFRSASL